MRFASGETRFVIITDKYAIKIARIRPLRPLVRIVQHLFGKKVKQELLTFDKKMAKGCMRYVLPGIFANRAEWKHSQKYGASGLIVPTLYSFFWVVNIQKAGVAATSHNIGQSLLFALFGTNELADMQGIYQYCVIEEKVLLADYGQMEAESFLAMGARVARA
jgi:hypothetical protein